MTDRIAFLLCTGLLTGAIGMAAWLEPRADAWRGRRAQADSLLWTLLGDGRRLFANHFYVKADVYLHRGYYPSIFDQARQACQHGIGSNPEALAEPATGTGDHGCGYHCEHDDHEHAEEPSSGFERPARDWIDRLSRHFRVIRHTHLEGEHNEGEVLPWLRLAAEFDPHQVEVYVTASYWLSRRLGKPDQAEAFLRRGLRANPESEEILFELGRVAWEHRRDPQRARHLWSAAEQAWQQRYGSANETNRFLLSRILAFRAQMEEDLGHWDEAIHYWSRLRDISPNPEAVARRVIALQNRLLPAQ